MHRLEENCEVRLMHLQILQVQTPLDKSGTANKFEPSFDIVKRINESISQIEIARSLVLEHKYKEAFVEYVKVRGAVEMLSLRQLDELKEKSETEFLKFSRIRSQLLTEAKIRTCELYF